MQPLLILELLRQRFFVPVLLFWDAKTWHGLKTPPGDFTSGNWNLTSTNRATFSKHHKHWKPKIVQSSRSKIPKYDEGSSSLPRLNLRATLRPCSSFAGWDSKKSCIFSHQLGHVHLMGYTRKTGKWAGMFVNIPENGLECSAKNGLCSCIPKFETRGTTFSGHFVVFNTAVRGVSNLDSFALR